MDTWLKQLQKYVPGDRVARFVLVGGTILLFLIVLIDAFGARARAVAANQAALETPPAAQMSSATVPSVYRVPRDLASEAVAARAAARTAMAEAEAPQGLPDETPEDATDVAGADMAPESGEDVVAELADDGAAGGAEDTPAEEGADDAAPQGVAQAEHEGDGLALLASADISNGEGVWRQCRACHVHDAPQNRGGPHLVNIIGRDIGTAEGWRYSNALSEHGGMWTVSALLAWLENPDTYIPGNQMAFRGLRNAQDRIDLLGFLQASHAD